MTELKTLKDIEGVLVYDELGNPIDTAVQHKLLIEEAIKWVKMMESKKGLISNKHTYMFETFFNITEEDLKDE